MRIQTFAKGHGTENDFVIVPDPDDRLTIDADQVRILCDRRAGIGGDGLIRVVPDRQRPDLWFMDYRNADGSIAEMCGNGVRVFVAYLTQAGLVTLDDGQSLTVTTRAGDKVVRREGDLFAVDMGCWALDGTSEYKVTLREGVTLPAVPVDVGNPHAVVVLPDLAHLQSVDLTEQPAVHPDPAGGINVELIVPSVAEHPERGHLTMRVNERGVGETRSCGTGAVAAAAAARYLAGHDAPLVWDVDVPGGRLQVRLPEDPNGGDRVDLVGPAVLVAEGTLPPWLTDRSSS